MKFRCYLNGLKNVLPWMKIAIVVLKNQFERAEGKSVHTFNGMTSVFATTIKLMQNSERKVIIKNFQEMTL